jgi:hypothetical protein
MPRSNAVFTSLAGAALMAWAAESGATGTPVSTHVRVGTGMTAGAVDRALTGARRRLEHPACQRLFADFQDGAGRPLHEALESKGLSGPEHLGRLLFYDGTNHAPCASARTLAFTVPGSTVVFVCPAQFVREARRDLFLAEAALIHEGLHALGLRENPPTSAAITSRVMTRCGSR